VIWLVQLVFDVADPDAITRFWGRALEYRNPLVWSSEEEVAAFRREHPQFDGRGRIDDADLRRPPVYLQRVPEPKAGRNRVRPELAAADPAALEARLRELGATPGDHPGAWADVEGNELTVVEAPGEVRLRSIVVDAVDPERQQAFWQGAIGDLAAVERTWHGTHFEADGAGPLRHICGAGAEPGPAPFDLTPDLRFEPTDTPKTAKNRLHVDLNSTDVEADRDRLVGLGATVLQWDTDQVLADPEGNELCLSGMRS